MRLKRWFLNNFVLICEVVGYILSLSVIGFAVVSAFIRVEILQPVTGALEAARVPVASPAASSVLEFLANRGEEVATGTAVCRIVVGDELASTTLSARSLAIAAGHLGERDGSERAEVARTLAALRSRLEAGGAVKPLPAPSAGVFVPTAAGAAVASVAAGEALAHIVDPATAVLSGTVPLDKADRVSTGAAARLTPPGGKGVLAGRVVGVVKTDSNARVGLSFSAISPALAEELRSKAVAGGADAGPSMTAQVVVGSQSLFSKLFSRKQ
jgi:hypothetical protein